MQCDSHVIINASHVIINDSHVIIYDSHVACVEKNTYLSNGLKVISTSVESDMSLTVL